MATTRLSRSRRQYVAPPMPGFIEFQPPKLVAKPPSGPAWLHEIKFDGYRLQVRVEKGRVTIFTRNGHDWTARFPELASDAATLSDCILDGELCALDAAGHPTFRSCGRRSRPAGLRAWCSSCSIFPMAPARIYGPMAFALARRSWRSSWRTRRLGCAGLITSRWVATPSCNRPAPWAWRASSPNAGTRPTRRAATTPG
jgi:hypothetical protein